MRHLPGVARRRLVRSDFRTVLCLTNRLHAVTTCTTEFAGITHKVSAVLTCTHCGLERDVQRDAARLVIESAVSHAAIVETLSPAALEGEFHGPPPAGTEWLFAPRERVLAA
jgi:hypothetical protein